MHAYGDVATELGRFRVAWSSEGICMICRADMSRKAFESEFAKRHGNSPLQQDIPERYASAIRQAALGCTYAPVPIDLSGLTDFQRKVLNILQKVPRGEVRTYLWLAEKAGKPRASRAVGNTMARNPVPILVPCHRIVPRCGGVGNYGLGPSIKRELLKREGVSAVLLQI